MKDVLSLPINASGKTINGYFIDKVKDNGII